MQTPTPHSPRTIKLRHPSKNIVALAAVCLASLMFGLEISSVPVILPALEHVFSASFRQMQWVMNAYTIACTTVLMATGTLADRFGRRRVLLISVILFGITSLICGLAQDVSLLIIARFLQGMSGGAMLICQVAALSHQFQAGRERSMAFSAWGIIFGIGLGFGPIIGGMIVALANWQWVFLIHVAIAMVTVCLIVLGVQESRDPQAEKLDGLGMVTLSLAVFALAYFITEGPALGFGSNAALTVIALGIASFVAFVLVEKRSARPMFDFSVFRIRRFSGALFGSMGMNFSFWPLMIYLPMFFQRGLGYDSVSAGLSLLLYTLPTLVVPPFAERLVFRYRADFVIPAGLFVIGLGFMGMTIGSSVGHVSWGTMLPGLILSGIGLGLTNTPVTNTTTGAVPSDRAGMASGIDMSARLITLAVNIALMGLILLAGIQWSMRRALPALRDTSLDAAHVRLLAEAIAADGGTASTSLATLDPSGAIAHAALLHGFAMVTLYGGIGVWILAVLSLATFGVSRRAHG